MQPESAGMIPGAEGPVDREEIRRRLEAACPPAERYLPVRAPWVPAAVLIALVRRESGPSVVLTRRTEDLEHHPGQISFPGGKVEPDDSGPADAALREAFEEVGLLPRSVELIGCLPPHDTVTGFRVFPYVGWIEPPVTYSVDPREVADVFEVPLAFIIDPGNHRFDSLVVEQVRHTFYVIEYETYRIWGATAGMLVTLARALHGEQVRPVSVPAILSK
jgi:8-oxo-dGTP pyrophosphatase MutT (NUDIX family)